MAQWPFPFYTESSVGVSRGMCARSQWSTVRLPSAHPNQGLLNCGCLGHTSQGMEVGQNHAAQGFKHQTPKTQAELPIHAMGYPSLPEMKYWRTLNMDELQRRSSCENTGSVVPFV